MEPEQHEVSVMLTEPASRPTIHSSVPHQRQDPHKALADLALLTLRNAEIGVGLSSRADYVSKAGYTLLSKGWRASRLSKAIQQETENWLITVVSMIQGPTLPAKARPVGAGSRSLQDQ
jgi:hypothetical protein